MVLSTGDERHEVLKISSYWMRLLYVSLKPRILKESPDSVYGIVLNDNDDLKLSSLINSVKSCKQQTSIKSAIARKLLISCLTRYVEIERLCQKSAIISSMLLKISAYEIMQSLVYFSGLPGSPLHQLDLVRSTLEPNQVESENISLALEIIGVERATTSVLRRCIPSYSRLASNRYDRPLIEAKIKFLYESGMTADCYYYIGKVCADILKTLDRTFLHTYGKLVQIGMDLSMDIEHIQRWNLELAGAAKHLLASHRTVNAG
jgi:hypothetical protein